MSYSTVLRTIDEAREVLRTVDSRVSTFPIRREVAEAALLVAGMILDDAQAHEVIPTLETIYERLIELDKEERAKVIG